MNFNIDPIRPYLPLVYLGILIALVLGGCSWGKSIQKNKDAELIAQKDEALRAARDSLRAAGNAIRTVNAEAELRIERAKKSATASKAAGEVAESAKEDAADRDREFERRVERARKDLTCAALLNTNVEEVCNL